MLFRSVRVKISEGQVVVSEHTALTAAQIEALSYLGIRDGDLEWPTLLATVLFCLLAGGALGGYLLVQRHALLGSHARLGRGELLVAEADESDGSFLRLSPTIVAVTNLDREHLDHYGSMEKIYDSFLEFINKIPFYGLAVLCSDDERLHSLFPRIVKRYHTYGLNERPGVVPDFKATDIVLKQWGAEFRAHFRGKNLGPFRLAVPGIHNVSNALAAIALGVALNIPLAACAEGLSRFHGVERRFIRVGETRGITVVDDFAHNPAKVKAALETAKGKALGKNRRVLAVFHPHGFAPMKLMGKDIMDATAEVLDTGDRLYLPEIYYVGGTADQSISSEHLVEYLNANKPIGIFLHSKDEVLRAMVEEARPGDFILSMGARDPDLGGFSRKLLESLTAKG